MSTDTIQALRIGDLLIDQATGEILSEEDYDIDTLTLWLKDGQENEKAWKAFNGAMKSAVGRKLDQAGVPKALTPSGVATWRTRVDTTASFANLDEVTREFLLVEEEVTALMDCGRDFDVKKLNALRERLCNEVPEGVDMAQIEKHLIRAIDALIQEKTIHYVQLMPLRRAAPVVETVELQREDYPNA